MLAYPNSSARTLNGQIGGTTARKNKAIKLARAATTAEERGRQVRIARIANQELVALRRGVQYTGYGKFSRVVHEVPATPIKKPVRRNPALRYEGPTMYCHGCRWLAAKAIAVDVIDYRCSHPSGEKAIPSAVAKTPHWCPVIGADP